MIKPLTLFSGYRMMLQAEIRRRIWIHRFNRIRNSSFKEMEKTINIKKYIAYDKEKDIDE